MNIQYHKRVYPEFDFQIKTLAGQDGRRRLVVMCFRQDGTMWLKPGDLSVGPQHAPLLARFNAPYLLINERDHTVLINARAVAEIIAEPERRTQWLAFVERMIREHQQIRAQYESTRND